jgi:hypothetical protein
MADLVKEIQIELIRKDWKKHTTEHPHGQYLMIKIINLTRLNGLIIQTEVQWVMSL